MQAYVKIFFCALLIYAISIATTFNQPRKLDLENIILDSTEFTFSDINNESNFYSVTPETINSVFKKLNDSDVEILSLIIKDEKQNWGPINYKIINFSNSLFGTTSNFLSRLNDSAKFAVYYTSIMLLKKFGSNGIKELSKLIFYEQNSSARAAILEILQSKSTSEESKSSFKKELLSEIDKSEKFITKFHTKYCKDFSKKCLVPSLEKWYIEGQLTPDNIQKRRLEFRRYRNSDEAQNFEYARNFLPIFPELKNRLCNNQEANRLRGLYYKEKWEAECLQNASYNNKIQRTVKSNILK